MDFELLINIKTIKTMGTFEVGLNAFFHHKIAITLWGSGKNVIILIINDPHEFTYLKTWAPVW